MSQGLTERQEKFCQAIVSGMAITEAYRQHYSSNGSKNRVYVDASRLASNPKVALRVAELRALRQERETYSLELARCKLLDVYQRALESKHYNAAISALTEINRISGFHVQKVELTGEITHRDERLASFTTDEIKAFVIAKRAELEAGSIDASYQELDTESIKDAGQDGLESLELSRG